jgi:hypothetical protein
MMVDIVDCKLHLDSLRVMQQIPHELKLGVGHVRRVQGTELPNEKCCAATIYRTILNEEKGRGLQMRMKPGASASSPAEVVFEETRVSFRAKDQHYSCQLHQQQQYSEEDL